MQQNATGATASLWTMLGSLQCSHKTPINKLNCHSRTYEL